MIIQRMLINFLFLQLSANIFIWTAAITDSTSVNECNTFPCIFECFKKLALWSQIRYHNEEKLHKIRVAVKLLYNVRRKRKKSSNTLHPHTPHTCNIWLISRVNLEIEWPPSKLTKCTTQPNLKEHSWSKYRASTYPHPTTHKQL